MGDKAFFDNEARGKSVIQLERIVNASLGPLYVFVANDPTNHVDSLGLDRYVTHSRTFFHTGLAVDLWRWNGDKDKCCFEKTGTKYFDFSIAYSRAVDDLTSGNIGNIVLGVLGAAATAAASTIITPGEVTPEDSGVGHTIDTTIKSHPIQDMALLRILEGAAANPPPYNIFLANSNDFAFRYRYRGYRRYDWDISERLWYDSLIRKYGKVPVCD